MIIVLGETSSGTPSGNGQIGNDGTVDGGPGNDTVFVRGGDGDNGYVTDRGGNGEDGNNRTILGGGGIDHITVIGGSGGEGGIKRGDCGTGGIGNITAQGTVIAGGGPGGSAMSPANWDADGGAGGGGSNSEIYLLGCPGCRPALPAGTLLGGNGEPGRPGGGAGLANNGALTGNVTAFDGTAGPTLP
ncbi:hypothetical protein [Streptomyces sp. NPDC001903]|uniref:hypothetical protein n=1 Tax=Streptomyces sp. NPDC001903 TaxID=3364622 RepID=UPI0036BFF36C